VKLSLSHGSNLSKASPFQATDPRPDENRCLIERILFPSVHLAIPGCGLPRRAPVGNGSGCTEQRVSLVYCYSQVEVVPQTFSPFPGQTDVGVSDTLHVSLCFFGHPNAAPARPALRLGRPRPAWSRLAAFPCSAFNTGGFRSALYTGSPVSSRRNDVKHPVSTAYLLVQAYQLSFGLLRVTVLASVHFVLTMSSNSNSTPG